MKHDFKPQSLNNIGEFTIPIWIRNKIQFSFYTLDGNSYRYLRLSIWLLHQIKDLKEGEWFMNKWTHLTLFRWRMSK